MRRSRAKSLLTGLSFADRPVFFIQQSLVNSHTPKDYIENSDLTFRCCMCDTRMLTALLRQRRFWRSQFRFRRSNPARFLLFSCRGNSRRSRRGANAVLCQQRQIPRFVRVDVVLKFRGTCLRAHPIVKHRVIGTQSVALF